MSSDFLPLEVGNQWIYDVKNEAGDKVGQMAFGVLEYTIVSGTSFYVLDEFPFTAETGEPIRYIRYDRVERQFIRRQGIEEGPLFWNDAATTEVIEADSSGVPQKFVLKSGDMALTFQRGVGIVSARMEGPRGLLTATMVDLKGKSFANTPGPSAAVAVAPKEADRVFIPPPITQPNRRAETVATVTSGNPRIDVGANASAEGHQLVMVVTNTSEKLLPFRFESGQTYDFVIADADGREVWRWSNGRFFTQVTRSDSIRAKARWQFEGVWDHRDNDGNPVPPGQYRLTAIVTSLPAVHGAPIAIDVR